MMRISTILFALVLLLSNCNEDSDKIDIGTLCPDGVKATVRDLSGLDGCGFVFELKDGTKLQPFLLGYCGMGPLPKEVTEDPLYQFEFVDGKEVVIDYNVIEPLGTCMVGPIVKIKCLQESDESPAPTQE